MHNYKYSPVTTLTLCSYRKRSTLSIYLFFLMDISDSFFLFIYSHVHTLFGPVLPTIPAPLPLPATTRRFQAEPDLPLPLILLKRRYKQ
jgi:hypothetical protein